MARPKRASSLSTTKVTFRLTADEARQLDELVKELGFKDRSGLVRSWLAQSRSFSRGTGESVRPSVEANTATASGDAKENVDETATTRPGREDEPPKQTAPSNNFAFEDLLGLVVAALHHAADPRSGWSHIPKAARVILPLMTPDEFLRIMDALKGAGMLELSPPNGRDERVRIEDAALCPRNSRGKVLSRARLIGKWRELLAAILPQNPG
jgi:hypothetical protein